MKLANISQTLANAPGDAISGETKAGSDNFNNAALGDVVSEKTDKDNPDAVESPPDPTLYLGA